MKILYSPVHHDDVLIEEELIHFIGRKTFDNYDVAKMLILLHSKQVISDKELLDIIGEPYAELRMF